MLEIRILNSYGIVSLLPVVFLSVEGEVTAAAKSILCILSPLLLAEMTGLKETNFYVETDVLNGIC